MSLKIININVYDKDGFFSPYSSLDTPLISEEVADFLNNQCLTYKTKNDLKIMMKISNFNVKNKELYQNAIHAYYVNKSEDYKYYIHRDTFLSCLFMIIAIIIMILLGKYGGNIDTVFSKIVDITAWSFTCAAVEKFCFERTGYKRNYKKCIQVINAPIEFIVDNKQI